MGSSDTQNLNGEEQSTEFSLNECAIEQQISDEIAKNSLILVEMGISLDEQKRRFQGMAPSVITKMQRADIRWWKGFKKMDRKSGLTLIEPFCELIAVDVEEHFSAEEKNRQEYSPKEEVKKMTHKPSSSMATYMSEAVPSLPTLKEQALPLKSVDAVNAVSGKA